MVNIDTLQHMKKLNDEIREDFIKNASQYSSDFDKFQYIVARFLREYEFDYSVLRSENELDSRPFREKCFVVDGKKYFGQTTKAIDGGNRWEFSVSPSLHALKMGTCAYFSREIELFCKEFKVDYRHINDDIFCYDGHESIRAEDEVRKMSHHYSVLSLDGNEYKVDVAGAIMAIDYKRKYPNSNIKPEDFVFVDDVGKNPFDDISKNIKSQPGEN